MTLRDENEDEMMRTTSPSMAAFWRNVVRGGGGSSPTSTILLAHSPPPLPSHTTTPKNILWRELLDRDWDAARLRLTLYPGDVFYNPEQFDKRGAAAARRRNNNSNNNANSGGVTTCLHVACRNRSPLDIIQRLLDLYPGAICRQDSEGWTPLHTHILHGSVGTVGNHSRERDFCRVFGAMLHLSTSHGCYQQHYPHHHLYPSTTEHFGRSSWSSSSSVASIHAHTTGSPLHLFCCHGHHHDANELALLRSLVEADPTQVVKPDPNGCFPGTLLWRLYRNRHRRFLDAQGGGQLMIQTNHDNRQNTTSRTVTTIPIPDPGQGILQILFMFLAAVRGDHQTDRHSLQDVIAYQSRYAGPDRTDFVRLYLENYPKSVGQWNDEGKLPIHVAAAAWPRHVTRPSGLVLLALSPPRTLAACAVDPLWRLLQDAEAALPETAGCVDRSNGRLALHYALTAPLQQLGNQTLSSLLIQRNKNKIWSPPACLAEDGGLAALVNAYPTALSIPDPQTGLPAAALAAWVAGQVHVTDELATVGLVYDILRLCPCILPHYSV